MGIEVVSISPAGMTLKSGEEIPAATVVWCAGMRANPLTRLFPVERDRFGRLPVDEFMRVRGMANVFAAGDVAWAMMDERHASVMSCQHGRPMGRFAGHNVVCDLFGLTDAPAAYRVVCDRAGPGSMGGRLYRRVGPPCRREGRGGEEDQADDQLPSDLSAVEPQSPGNPRRGSAGRAGTAQDLSLAGESLGDLLSGSANGELARIE